MLSANRDLQEEVKTEAALQIDALLTHLGH